MRIFLDKLLLIICSIGLGFSLYGTFIDEFEPWLLIVLCCVVFPWAVSLCLHDKTCFWADPETKLDKIFLLFFTCLFTICVIALIIIIFLSVIMNDELELYQYFIWVAATIAMSRMTYWHILQSNQHIRKVYKA